MSAGSLLQEWLGQLKLGDGTSPRLDPDGFARLSIGGAFPLTIAANEDRRLIGIFAPLLSAEGLDAAALRHAMSLNLALAVLGGGALAVGEDNDIVYVRTTPIDTLDAGKFSTLLQDSIGQAEGARNAILERAKTASPSEAEAAPSEGWLRL